jgi:hypothetical protein
MFEPGGEAWSEGELRGSDKRLTLEQLNAGFGGLATPDARIAYAQSAAIVAALLDRGGPMVIVGILQDLARGDGVAAALERQLAVPFDSFVATLGASH